MDEAEIITDTHSALEGMSYKPAPSFRFLLSLAAHWQYGTAHVVLPNGERLTFRGRETGPEATLVVHRDRFARRSIIGGQLGFCEGYLDGDWSSPDPARWMELFLRNEHHMEEVLIGQAWARFLMKIPHLFRRNSRGGSKKNISKHYDLGNAFYSLWLDRGMTYSSAIFAEAAQDLEAAQQNKYKILAQRLGVLPEHHVLEIGCGWGGFAEYVAKEIGARVTGITISEEQHKFAQRRIQHAGLSDRVEVLLKDYRDVSGQYDRIASIEMVEAVGESYWPQYFGILRDRLKPGGKAGLQAITIDEGWFHDYRNTADFIQKYVFPGGMLPTKSIIARQTELAGMNLESMEGFGADYARTLRRWQGTFESAWPDVSKLGGFDEKFKRTWELYLAYCEAGFCAGTIDVVHAVLTKY